MWRSREPDHSTAFTLIEVLAAMAIVAVLMAFAFGGVRVAKQRAAAGRTKSELTVIAQALEEYKRHYGDYPQTGAAAQAAAVVTTAIGTTPAQALLFNALTGVYGPTNFTTRLNGPMLIQVSKLRTEIALTATTFAIPTGNPPTKPVVANSLLDAWGNRYLYYYKPLTPQGRPPTNTWRAAAYVLYSAGPDGQHVAPNSGTGLFTGTTQSTGTNADNIYANP